MISFDILILFLITTFVVVLSPGPAAVAVTAEAASNGYKRSFLVILGIAMANVVFFVLSATGIAALIIASSLMFTVIKWIGVSYLIYLGMTAIFSKAGPLQITPEKKATGKIHRVFLRGFILELSNPKALLYFSALLPQFIDITQPVLPQLAVLGLITIFIDVFCYSLYSILGYQSTKLNLKPQIMKWINRTAGGMLIFSGLKMSTVER